MDGEKIIIAFAAVPLCVYFISSFCKQTSLSGHWTNQTIPPRWFRVKLVSHTYFIIPGHTLLGIELFIGISPGYALKSWVTTPKSDAVLVC